MYYVGFTTQTPFVMPTFHYKGQQLHYYPDPDCGPPGRYLNLIVSLDELTVTGIAPDITITTEGDTLNGIISNLICTHNENRTSWISTALVRVDTTLDFVLSDNLKTLTPTNGEIGTMYHLPDAIVHVQSTPHPSLTIIFKASNPLELSKEMLDALFQHCMGRFGKHRFDIVVRRYDASSFSVEFKFGKTA